MNLEPTHRDVGPVQRALAVTLLACTAFGWTVVAFVATLVLIAALFA